MLLIIHCSLLFPLNVEFYAISSFCNHLSERERERKRERKRERELFALLLMCYCCHMYVAISVLCRVLVIPWVSQLSVIVAFPGLEVIKLFSCSTELSTKFILLINIKMPTINIY